METKKGKAPFCSHCLERVKDIFKTFTIQSYSIKYSVCKKCSDDIEKNKDLVEIKTIKGSPEGIKPYRIGPNFIKKKRVIIERSLNKYSSVVTEDKKKEEKIKEVLKALNEEKKLCDNLERLKEQKRLDNKKKKEEAEKRKIEKEKTKAEEEKKKVKETKKRERESKEKELKEDIDRGEALEVISNIKKELKEFKRD
jgi:hypothetical protein